MGYIIISRVSKSPCRDHREHLSAFQIWPMFLQPIQGEGTAIMIRLTNTTIELTKKAQQTRKSINKWKVASQYSDLDAFIPPFA